jgi:hypothetical protein
MNKFDKFVDDFTSWGNYHKAKKAYYQKELPQFKEKLTIAEYNQLSEAEKDSYFMWETHVLYAKCE